MKRSDGNAEPLSAFYWRENMQFAGQWAASRAPSVLPASRRRPAQVEQLRARVKALYVGKTTQQDIAAQLGCTRRYVQRLLAGSR